MNETKYMVIDKVEELLDDAQKVIGRLVTDKAGEELKVKKGQGGKLADRWEELDNGIGKAFEFTMGMFKGYPFVSEFKEVKEIFKQQAIAKVGDTQGDSKLRAFALSYAKDIHVAALTSGRVEASESKDLLTLADKFLWWLQGKEVQSETKTSTKTQSNEETPEPDDGRQATGEKSAKIRPNQIEQLQEFKKKGISLKPFIEELGWGITRIIDLSEAQAETLITKIKKTLTTK